MAIQQHPIPQNVTQFQFKLVGDMTLKQFLELAGGIVVAVIIYALPLPVFFKWPLMALAAGLGAGMAFVPVEGRPLDQWLIAFVRSIYQPTIYVWKKTSLSPEETINQTRSAAASPQTEVGHQITTASPTVTHGAVSIPSPVPTSIGSAEAVAAISFAAPTLPNQQINQSTNQPAPNTPKAQTVFQSIPSAPLKIEHQTPATVAPVAAVAPNNVVAPPSPQNNQLPNNLVTPVTAPKQLLPIPHPPQTPNTIVGMTLTPGGSILDSAIVEITLNKATVRATKSNKLGQFLFAKPLDNGLYQITAERQGYSFPTYSLNLIGDVVQPIALKATGEA